jgi:hypothetical protein
VSHVGPASKMTLVVAALGLGACAIPDSDSFRAPDASAFFRPMSVTNYKDRVLPPVTPADLVDAGGNCSGVPGPAASGEGVPAVSSVIALEMTECEVVKRAGIAQRVVIGTNERGQRTATLTYINGQRPGLYHFTDGRLSVMEAVLEQPAAPKTAKKQAKRAN